MLSDSVVWPCTNGKDVYRQQLQMSWGCYYQCCLGHTACGCNHSGKRLALAQREQRADRRAFALPFAICATLSQCQRCVFCCVRAFSFELEPTYPYSQNLQVKHYPWLPAPANWCAFASKEVHVASTSPDLRHVALFSEGLSHDRCNCLWQLTGVIYHIGQEGRLFEYELYIDWIKVIHMQKGFWNLTALSSCIHVHRFVPAWCTPLHRWIDGDWSCNVAEKRRHWAYFTILFWQFAEEKCDR